MRFPVLFCVEVFTLLNVIGGHNAENSNKRLLVNDPSLMDQRLSHLESLVQKQALQISSMDLLIKKLEKQSANSSGAIFTRWGKRTCPSNTVTVYSGFAAGGYYNDEGGSPEYLCLTRDAVVGPEPGTSYWNSIYGVEYETNFWKADSGDEDAPCAVCKVPTHTTMMMLPGRDTCYNGWTLQYAGHLGSGYYDHPSNHDYACVDKDVDYLSGGEGRDTDGALFYPVVAYCGTLQCPPYKRNRVVMCAICTQ